MAKLKTFSLYLAKSDVAEFDDLLTESARALVGSGAARKSTSEQFGDGGALYAFPNQPHVPNWVAQLRPIFSLPDLFAQSPCAVLAFKRTGSLFALTFSYGHVYALNEGAWYRVNKKFKEATDQNFTTLTELRRLTIVR